LIFIFLLLQDYCFLRAILKLVSQFLDCLCTSRTVEQINVLKLRLIMLVQLSVVFTWLM